MCSSDLATFIGDDGVETDLTDALTTGTYTTLDHPGTLEVCPGTWFARLVIRADVTVKGLGAAEDTILSGGESGTILDLLGPDVRLTVQDLTLDRGAGLDKDHNSGGGGIYCEGVKGDTSTDVLVERVIFSNNYANDGAGLYAVDCTTRVFESSFVDNLSDDDGGSFTTWYSDVDLQDVSFARNQGLDGGAMALFYTTAALEGLTFEDNVGTHVAGAIWVYESDVTLTSSTFTANSTPEDGGAILLYGAGVLDGVTFDGNTGGRGGALFVYYESTAEASGCAFSGNVADDVYAADYSEAGGTSYTAGADATFSCAANTCTGL